MPIYEYECGRCRFRFEMRQGFDAEPASICPQCRGKARRIIQAAPVLFKGSGFYITDSRKGKEVESGGGLPEKSHKEDKGKKSDESAASARK